MIYELQKNQFDSLGILLKKYDLEKYNVLASMIEGHNRFRVFVDDVVEPRTAFVWAINCMFYFIGEPDNPDFNNYFPDTLYTVIAPDSLAMGGNAFICTLLREEG